MFFGEDFVKSVLDRTHLLDFINKDNRIEKLPFRDFFIKM
jgi:hypothetical protein